MPIPAADRSPAGTAGQAPTVTIPTGPPPTSLESADLIVGTGRAAVPGDKVTVQYVLATYSAQKVIQSSWTSQPFTFTLGEGQVIPGWDKGVVGMHVGGRRELIIPPSLGYGATPPAGAQGIASNDTLIFVIDLLSVGLTSGRWRSPPTSTRCGPRVSGWWRRRPWRTPELPFRPAPDGRCAT